MKIKLTRFVALAGLMAATGLLASSQPVSNIVTDGTYKQCSEGAAGFDWKLGKMWTCFTKPQEFKIKVYQVRLVAQNGNEKVVYEPNSPDYIDLVSGTTSLIDSAEKIPAGTYDEIRIVVDTIYMVKLDQTIKDEHGEWLVRTVGDRLSKDANFVIEPTSSSANGNQSYSANSSSSASQGAVFSVNMPDKAAVALPYRHGSFLALPSNAGVQDQDYPCNYFGGRMGGYPMRVTYSYASGPLSELIHAVDRDANNDPIPRNTQQGNCPWVKPLNCQDVTGQQCSSFTDPYRDARRATISSKLRSPITIDPLKAQVLTWTWDLTKAVGILLNTMSGSTLGFNDSKGKPSHQVTMITMGDLQFSLSLVEGVPIASQTGDD